MTAEKTSFVTRFFVAGVQHHLDVESLRALARAIAEDQNDEVTLIPQPSNHYDPKAIQIYYGATFLGFVPAKNGTNQTLFSRVSQGKLKARIFSIFPDERPWEAICVEVRE